MLYSYLKVFKWLKRWLKVFIMLDWVMNKMLECGNKKDILF